MAIAWMAYAWKDGPMDSNERYVYLAVADFANDEGKAFPSMATICDRTRLSESSVRRAIQSLERDGWMTVIRGNGAGKRSQYTLKRVSPGNLSDRRVSTGKVSDGQEKGFTLTEKGCQPDKSPTPPIKSNRHRIVNEPSPQQVVLYKAYPRHVAPQDAYKAIEKALKVRAFDQLLLVVQNFSRKCSREGTEEKFIAHPATWFNRGSYDDDDLQPGYVNHSKENGNGRTNGNHPSPAKQRVDGARRKLAEIAVERGLLDPAQFDEQFGSEVSESGSGAEHRPILPGFRSAGPELLPPESPKGS